MSLLGSAFTCPGLAAAQTAPPQRQAKWEVEFHIGGQSARPPAGGTSRLPPPGSEFTYGGAISRRVPSWFFGDGAALLAQTIASLNAPGAYRSIPAPTSLDPILNEPLMARPSGTMYGLRVRRHLWSRFSAELAIHVGKGAVRVADPQILLRQSGVSRGSFLVIWDRLIDPELANFSPRTHVQPFPPHILRSWSIDATADVQTDEGGGRQRLFTGALMFDLIRAGSVVPYLTAGAGVGRDDAGVTTIDLRGRYRFTLLAPSIDPSGPLGIFEELDSVTVRYSATRTYPVGLAAAGLRFDLPKRQGIRVDVRVFVTGSPARTSLDARGVVVPSSPEFDVMPLYAPAPVNVVFSNHEGVRSSLGGAITDFTTRKGGRIVQTMVSFGYSLRF